jgi:hypothetical protein
MKSCLSWMSGSSIEVYFEENRSSVSRCREILSSFLCVQSRLILFSFPHSKILVQTISPTFTKMNSRDEAALNVICDSLPLLPRETPKKQSYIAYLLSTNTFENMNMVFDASRRALVAVASLIVISYSLVALVRRDYPRFEVGEDFSGNIPICTFYAVLTVYFSL